MVSSDRVAIVHQIRSQIQQHAARCLATTEIGEISGEIDERQNVRNNGESNQFTDKDEHEAPQGRTARSIFKPDPAQNSRPSSKYEKNKVSSFSLDFDVLGGARCWRARLALPIVRSANHFNQEPREQRTRSRS